MKETETLTFSSVTQLGDHVLINTGDGIKAYKIDPNQLIAALTADRDKWRDRCERLIAEYGVGQWTCCQPSYLHDCKTDICWLTVYEGEGQGADFAQQIKKEIDDDTN